MLLLVLIMSFIVLIVDSITVKILYDTALEETKSQLDETAKSQARLIEATARFDERYSSNYPLGARQATLAKIRDAHSKYLGFGKTGEFTLSKKEGNQIIFLLSHRHYDLDEPKPVPWDSKLAEPMRRALSGKSGTVIGLDYRGVKVLAAHEPVALLDLGIVAKMDLSEIREPFITAGLQSGLIAIVLIAAGSTLFFKITNPILQKLQNTVSDLEKALREVKTLKGFLPICSFCKKIRDDQGYWDQVETYIRKHSEVEFTHGLCPECVKKHYPELFEALQNRNRHTSGEV